MGNYDFSRPNRKGRIRCYANPAHAALCGVKLLRRSAAATTTASTAAPSSATALRATRNRDVLFAVEHKGHGRPHLVDVEVQIQKLLAGIGAIDLKVASRAGEYEVAGG